MAIVGTVITWIIALLMAAYHLLRAFISARTPAGKAAYSFDKATQQAIIVVASLLILVVALFRYSLQFGAVGFGRFLFPAAAAIAWLALLGWSAFINKRQLHLVAGVFSLGLLAYSLICIPWVIWANYKLPGPAPIEALQAAQPLDIHYAGAMRLVGLDFEPSIARPAQKSVVTMRLYWQTLTQTRWDLLAEARLVDPAGQKILEFTYWPVDARFPPSVWQPDQVYVDEIPIIIPENAYAGRYQAQVQLFPRGTTDPVAATDGTGAALPELVTVGELLVAAQVNVATEDDISNALNATVGQAQAIQLRGYDINQGQTEKGPVLEVTLFWKATETISEDYTVFVQLLDASGNLVAQQDNPPLGGLYPTSIWQPNALIPDSFTLDLPPDMPPETYRLITGMYRYPSLERLPVSQNGQGGKDYIELTSLSLP